VADEVVWEDPPPKARGAGAYDAQHEAMKTNPGKWLVWRSDCASVASAGNIARHLRNHHGYEAVARGTKVYARKVAP
jgi:hypothetical protein